MASAAGVNPRVAPGQKSRLDRFFADAKKGIRSIQNVKLTGLARLETSQAQVNPRQSAGFHAIKLLLLKLDAVLNKFDLQTANRQLGFRRQVSSLAGWLTMVVVLGCGLLSASPALHRLVHTDADSPDHACIVTVFTKGQLTPAPEIQIFVGLLLLFGGIRLLAETFAFCAADYRYSSSRAPPCFVV